MATHPPGARSHARSTAVVDVAVGASMVITWSAAPVGKFTGSCVTPAPTGRNSIAGGAEVLGCFSPTTTISPTAAPAAPIATAARTGADEPRRQVARRPGSG